MKGKGVGGLGKRGGRPGARLGPVYTRHYVIRALCEAVIGLISRWKT